MLFKENNMKTAKFKINVIILIFIFLSNTFASEIFISLKPDTIISPNRKYYIQNIIDSRPDTSNIGFAQDPTWDNKRTAKFEKGFTKEIKDYFSLVFPKQEGQTPIIMEFRDFNISYTFNAWAFQSKLKNKVTSDILFYVIQDSVPVLCHETAFALEKTGASNVSQNIKDLLVMSLNGFANTYWQDTMHLATYAKKGIAQKEEERIFKNKYINAATYFVLYSATTYVFFMLVMLTTKGN